MEFGLDQKSKKEVLGGEYVAPTIERVFRRYMDMWHTERILCRNGVKSAETTCEMLNMFTNDLQDLIEAKEMKGGHIADHNKGGKVRPPEIILLDSEGNDITEKHNITFVVNKHTEDD